jgi:hypothetical protein
MSRPEGGRLPDKYVVMQDVETDEVFLAIHDTGSYYRKPTAEELQAVCGRLHS